MWKSEWPYCKGATSGNLTSGGGILWHSGGKSLGDLPVYTSLQEKTERQYGVRDNDL
jgi:hypothetical protein